MLLKKEVKEVLKNGTVTIYSDTLYFSTTNEEGFFSINVHKGDSVKFSYIGYKSQCINIPNHFIGSELYADIFLAADTITLKEASVFSWKTEEEFKKEFLTLKLKDKDEENAKKNLELMTFEALNSDYYDPRFFDSKKHLTKQNENKVKYRGQFSPENMINLLAPIQFFIAIQKGELIPKKNEKYLEKLKE